MDKMKELKEEIQALVRRASAGDDPFDVSQYAGDGFNGTRPRMLVISSYVLNVKLLAAMKKHFRDNNVAYWPYYCASGPYGTQVRTLSIKSSTTEEGGQLLPWKDWMDRAIRIIQPQDIFLIGGYSDIKQHPNRLMIDRSTRGKTFVPFVFEDPPRRNKGEDYLDYVDRWEEGFRNTWFEKVLPHFDERYFADAPRIASSGLINAFEILKRPKRSAKPKEGKKETKLKKVE